MSYLGLLHDKTEIEKLYIELGKKEWYGTAEWNEAIDKVRARLMVIAIKRDYNTHNDHQVLNDERNN
ncbi:hypothetical protein DRO03_11380 [Methanosarcinales archaeon]|nr:MAG: hypothetical protein DRO03_11380 [Methanosarcinales archaeon]